MHSKKIRTVFSIGFIQRSFVACSHGAHLSFISYEISWLHLFYGNRGAEFQNVELEVRSDRISSRLRVPLVDDKFQMGNNERVATLVLQKCGDAWLIIHLHASILCLAVIALSDR